MSGRGFRLNSKSGVHTLIGLYSRTYALGSFELLALGLICAVGGFIL